MRQGGAQTCGKSDPHSLWINLFGWNRMHTSKESSLTDIFRLTYRQMLVLAFMMKAAAFPSNPDQCKTPNHMLIEVILRGENRIL
jgi:hypothetical protein